MLSVLLYKCLIYKTVFFAQVAFNAFVYALQQKARAVWRHGQNSYAFNFQPTYTDTVSRSERLQFEECRFAARLSDQNPAGDIL